MYRFHNLLVLTILTFASNANTDVKLPAIISDGMVLQQGKPVPIWGWAKPGEKITVTIGKQSIFTTANQNGNWMVKLDPLELGNPLEMTVVGTNTLKLRDILVGEVWLASGQSNMEFGVRGAINARTEIASANYPQMRLFTVPRAISEQPLHDTQGQWVACTPGSVPNFSAVAYFFGRELHKNLKLPIGLIHASWSATPIESWMSEVRGMSSTMLTKPSVTELSALTPTSLYNAMISPIIPYAIAGTIWYQGESNVNRAYQYRSLFHAMIKGWRLSWGQGDFPFLFVQIANFMNYEYSQSKHLIPRLIRWLTKFLERNTAPGESAFAELREAQLMALKLPNTGMAVTIDIGDAYSFHPKNKQDVGRRLALWAKATVYGKNIVHSGPLYKSMEIKANNAILSFDHIGDGLVSKGGGLLKGFSIAGNDQKFFWANARIVGTTVVVHSDKVSAPVAVRYAWEDNPESNLYNSADLPASPFRTDTWPGITITAKTTCRSEPCRSPGS
ncbi:MAG: sialate O-acetylesterase [Bdellovibrionota bacterium]